MATFAKLDENNIVLDVLKVADSDAPTEAAGISFMQGVYGASTNWAQGYFSAEDPAGQADKRYNPPATGGYWDPTNQAFVNSKPYASWTLDANYRWQAPVTEPAYDPEDASIPFYMHSWDEPNQRWLSASGAGNDPIEGVGTYNLYWDPGTSTWKDV